MLCFVNKSDNGWVRTDGSQSVIAPSSVKPYDFGGGEYIALFHFSKALIETLGRTRDQAAKEAKQWGLSLTTYAGLEKRMLQDMGVFFPEGLEGYRHVIIVRVDKDWFLAEHPPRLKCEDHTLNRDHIVCLKKDRDTPVAVEARITNPLDPQHFHVERVSLD